MKIKESVDRVIVETCLVITTSFVSNVVICKMESKQHIIILNNYSNSGTCEVTVHHSPLGPEFSGRLCASPPVPRVSKLLV